MVEAFGPDSTIAPRVVSALADALLNWRTARSDAFFAEWLRLFGIIYGEHFETHQQHEASQLAALYKVDKALDFQQLVFCVHTYFAILMKLIAAELLLLSESGFNSSFSAELTHCPDEELPTRLADLENGGLFARRGIRNFLEGDFFRWYLDAFASPPLREAIREIPRAIQDFEAATTLIQPEVTQDLLKKLYQYLVPQEVRHNLGEYYTPDWLGELLLEEAGYRGQMDQRFLDPSCGSGTFLVLAINRAKAVARDKQLSRKHTAQSVLSNIWGFDLNPIAVIAARTNYLFALGGAVTGLGSFEIPVYLADSVLWPRLGGEQLDLNCWRGTSGNSHELEGSVPCSNNLAEADAMANAESGAPDRGNG